VAAVQFGDSETPRTNASRKTWVCLVAVAVSGMFALLRRGSIRHRAGDATLIKYRALIMLERELATASWQGWSSAGRFPVWDSFVERQLRRSMKETKQREKRYVSDLVACGFLIRTNVGPIPDFSTFFQNALTNPALTGLTVARWSPEMEYFAFYAESWNFTMVVSRHRFQDWVSRIRSYQSSRTDRGSGMNKCISVASEANAGR
jgi:hypothetical protein